MKRILKVIELIAALIANPRLVATALHDNTYWRTKFRKRYGHQHPLPVLDLSQFVPDLATLDIHTFLGGGSMITDLLLLKSLSQRETTLVYFEIGTWRGESLAAVLPHIDHAYSLDLDDQSMYDLKYPEHSKSQLGLLVQKHDRVINFREDSASFDFSRVDRKCDLIYIDGNHTSAYVRRDTESVLKYLANERSIIVWHDYAHDPEHIRWEVYQAILDGLPRALHPHVYHVSNTKCAVLLRNPNLHAEVRQFPQKVDRIWQVTIQKKSLP